MKTSKKKSKELVDKYIPLSKNVKHTGIINDVASVMSDEILNLQYAKQCALICVDEIIDQWEYIDTYISDLGGKLNPNLKYWLEVKQELLKL